MVNPAQEITLARTIFALPDRIYAAFTTAEGWCAGCCERAEVVAQMGGSLHIYADGYQGILCRSKLEIIIFPKTTN